MAFAGTPKVLLDWCGGKGYLSRYLARPGRRVECLEWQAGLCPVRAELLLDDMTFYPLNEFNEETKLSFFINIDSSKVKKNLPPAFIDSLHQNNIKIFHGTISSNKVPLKIKE